MKIKIEHTVEITDREEQALRNRLRMTPRMLSRWLRAKLEDCGRNHLRDIVRGESAEIMSHKLPTSAGWYWYLDIEVDRAPRCVYVRDYAGDFAIGNRCLPLDESPRYYFSEKVRHIPVLPPRVVRCDVA